MSTRRFIFYTIVLVVLCGAYLGYRFYENHAKSIPAAKETYERIELADRAFLQQTGFVNQLPRKVAKRSPSLTTPVWTYTPEKWGGAIDSVKVIALATDTAGFDTIQLLDGNTYRLPLPREQTLLNRDIISDREEVYRIFTTPENAPEFPPPSLDDFPVPYPLIAKFLNKQDDASLTEFADWIKSVGGAVRAQSLLEGAGLSDSIRIQTATIYRE